jgi:hypothetical protein
MTRTSSTEHLAGPLRRYLLALLISSASHSEKTLDEYAVGVLDSWTGSVSDRATFVVLAAEAKAVAR